MPDRDLKELRRTSDDLMASLEELKDLEARKREHEISTPRFHRLAEDVEDQARRVFELAAYETDVGEDAGPPKGITTDDVQRDRRA